jgi:hypothetical protein
VAPAFERVAAAESEAAAGRDIDRFREALAEFIDLAADLAAKPYEAPAFNAAAMGDSGGSVLEMLRSQGAAE